MKNKILICSLVIVSLIACNKNTFKVDVEMANANGKMVYLQKLIDNQFVNIDSALVDNNKVLFDVKKDDNKDAYHIYIKGWRRAVPFFADNKDVVINGDFNAYHKLKVEASQTQQFLDSINKALNNLNEIGQKELITDFIKNNDSEFHDELGSYLVYRYKWLFTLDEFRELMTYFTDESKSYIEKLREYISMLERTEIGQPYIDFTMSNIDGEDITLSTLVGDQELLMIDFWAAWCPDCRVENPNIVEVYNDFKDKGIEIISVSLDTDREAWLKAIADDKLSWKNHVSELKGWNCSAASEYGVAFIPQNFLIDTNGIIVARNLNGKDLRIFVENYLSETGQ